MYTFKRKVKGSIKKLAEHLGKRDESFRGAYRRYLKRRRVAQYSQYCEENPVEPKVIMFESYMGRAYACSPKALYQEMLRDPRFAGYEFIWVFRANRSRPLRKRIFVDLYQENPEAAMSMHLGVMPPKYLKDPEALLANLTESANQSLSDEGELSSDSKGAGVEGSGVPQFDYWYSQSDVAELKKAKIVTYASSEYYRDRARAKYWITNSIMPTHMHPRDGQIMAQTWHGTPLKRLGCDLAEGTDNGMFSTDEVIVRYLNEAKRLSYMLSPSPFCTEKLKSAFNLEAFGKADCIIEKGYPRNDYLSRVTDEQIIETKIRLGIPLDKKVVLYAPTYRDNQHAAGKGYVYENKSNFSAWQKQLGDEYVVLFRAHYLVASGFDFDEYSGFVINASKVGDINDLYVVSDALVTDYSSVFFDYATLGRPIYFYMYDLEEYANNLRGFYLSLDDLPGPIAHNETELLEFLAADSQGFSGRDYDAFVSRFLPYEDGNSSHRVIDVLCGE